MRGAFFVLEGICHPRWSRNLLEVLSLQKLNSQPSWMRFWRWRDIRTETLMYFQRRRQPLFSVSLHLHRPWLGYISVFDGSNFNNRLQNCQASFSFNALLPSDKKGTLEWTLFQFLWSAQCYYCVECSAIYV